MSPGEDLEMWATNNIKRRAAQMSSSPPCVVRSMGSLTLATSDVLVTTVHIHTTSFHLPLVYHRYLIL